MTDNLKGKKILITAGPTREYLDPVRFISNESSGKTGYAIAETLFLKGAKVILISGPVNLKTILPSTHIIHVKTANEMYEASKIHFGSADVAIFSAAVADYRPKFKSDCKIKKSEQDTTIELIKNIDIAFEFGKVKSINQISIGFALETNDIHENALKKMESKAFDAVILNSPKEGEGFGYDTNKIEILRKNGSKFQYSLKSKYAVAIDIVNEISEILSSQMVNQL